MYKTGKIHKSNRARYVIRRRSEFPEVDKTGKIRAKTKEPNVGQATKERLHVGSFTKIQGHYVELVYI